ncbi:MAG: EAL domain-containing protein [Pseudomonadota bacterium]|nr:EAL domain-containing protein [Pseudomonadota bacterium]
MAWSAIAAGLLLLAGSILLQAGKQHRQYREMHQQQLRDATRQAALTVRARIGNAEMLLRWITERSPRNPDGSWEFMRTEIQRDAGYFSSVSVLPASSGSTFTVGAREFELTEREREALAENRTVLLVPRSATGAGRLYLMRELRDTPPRRRVLAELREGWWRSVLDPGPDTNLAVFDAWGQTHFTTRPQAPQIAAQSIGRLVTLPPGESVGNLAWNETGAEWVGAVVAINAALVTSDTALAMVALAPDRPWSAAFWSAVRTQATFLPLLLLAAWMCYRVGARNGTALRQMRRALGRLPDHRVAISASPLLFTEVRQLAEACNRASDAIRQQNDTRRVLDEIDGLLLPGGDHESVIDQVLGRVRAVTRAHNVGLTLVDPTASHGRLFAVNAAGGAPVTRVPLDADMVATLRGMEAGLTIARSEEGRHSFLAPLQAAGATFFWVWPVMAAGELAAILSVGYVGAPSAAASIAQTGTQCAQHLGASLASNARAERLYRQAHFDPLTQLPNRLLFRDQLQAELHTAARKGTKGALLYIDLDHFKRVNDSLGHEAGDQLLSIVAQRLRGCVKDGDTVARLGGDEFTIILCEVGGTGEVTTVARRVIESMRRPIRVGGREHIVRASIGITLFPDEDAGIDELLHNADLAMYRAKELGRGGAEFYNPKLGQRALDSGMFRALGRREFSLYFQPQYRVDDGSLAGIEALLRWQPPGGVMKTSAEFVPAAEESGLIVDLGGWVLEAACAQLAAWREAGIAAPVMAVNLSVQQLRDAQFAASLRRHLARHHLPPEALTFEMSEAALTDDDSQPCLAELADMGVGLTLDDFGTGSMALASLRRYPVQAVKIDSSCVAQLLHDHSAAALASTIIAMAHGLGRTVVAEGVEEAVQLEFLREQRCDLVQGYYMAHPLSAQDMTALLLGRLGGRSDGRSAAGG